MKRQRLHCALVAALMLVTSCGRGDGGESRSDAATEPEVVHVHGLGIDPADGVLFAATHYGVFRLPDDGAPVRVANRYQDTMGFTVAGPRHFLASGHPSVDDRQLRIEGKPPLLGLIESVDAGERWTSLSLLGEADFHALAFAHDTVYGHDATGGRFMVSRDRRQWETRSSVQLHAVAVSPTQSDVIVGVGDAGLVRSTDGGRTWPAVANAPDVQWVSWNPDGLWAVAPDGSLHRSDDAVTWTSVGAAPGSEPEALLAAGTRLFVATSSGIHESTDGGETWRVLYAEND